MARSPDDGRFRLELHAPNAGDSYQLWMDRSEAMRLANSLQIMLTATEGETYPTTQWGWPPEAAGGEDA